VRFYNITITDPESGQDLLASSLGGLPLTSLLSSGLPNMAALDIEFNIPMSAAHEPNGGAWLRIHGLSLQDIGSSTNLNGKSIKVYGGMSKGLPLATPHQKGLLVSGMIFQAVGNWEGTDQRIDVILAPSTGTADKPFNFVLDWKAGTQLSTALQQTLSTAFPAAKLNITISPNLVQAHDEPSFHGTLTQLATHVHDVSLAIITDPNYPGVDIVYDGETLNVTDQSQGSSAATPVQVNPQDLVGQPGWIGPNQIQASFVLRGDLRPGGYLTLPPTVVGNQVSTVTRFQDRVSFSGVYYITAVYHYGSYRQPDARSWVTVVEMTPETKNG
jgi:hypothetical protein